MNLVTLFHLMAMAVMITRDICTCFRQDNYELSNAGSLKTLKTQMGMRNSSSTSFRLLETQHRNAGYVSNASGRSFGGGVEKLKEAMKEDQDGDEQNICDWEGGKCTWNGDLDGFQVTTGAELAAKMLTKPMGAISGPEADIRGNPDGHFIYVGGQSHGNRRHLQLYSLPMKPTKISGCKLRFNVHANNIRDRKLLLFYETIAKNTSSAEIAIQSNVANNSWIPITMQVGKIIKEFRLMLEVWVGDEFPYHVAFDDIRLVNCDFTKQSPTMEGNLTTSISCNDSKAFECQPGQCVGRNAVCDINVDCTNGLDEGEICEEVIKWSGYCDFESGSCGWQNDTENDMTWVMRSDTNRLFDHTFQNSSGHYMYVDSSKSNYGHRGTLRSTTFPPPPRNHSNPDSPQYQSCSVRFYYILHGRNIGDLLLYLLELVPGETPENKTQLWRSSLQSKNENWQRITLTLPSITHRYYLQFVSHRGLPTRHADVAIDDFSLSPNCFTSGYKFTTCGASGSQGPTDEQCKLSYKSSGLKVTINDPGPMSGIQEWIVPESGIYSVTAKGGGGGQGLRNRRPSRGDVVYGVFNWTQGEVIYILVGQSGTSACESQLNLFSNVREMCDEMVPNKRSKRDLKEIRRKLQLENSLNKTIGNVGGGGGGGGATFIFKKNELTGTYIPLLISSGGGGLGTIIMEGAINPDGRGYSRSLSGGNGRGSTNGTGAGGGWNDTYRQSLHSGWSLASGGFGGQPYSSLTDKNGENGSGGYSYNASLQVPTILPQVTELSRSTKDGSVNIFPSFIGCGCDYQCVIFDVEGVLHSCICPKDQHLDENGRTCHVGVVIETGEYRSVVTQYLEIILPIILIIAIAAAIAMFLLYHRYRRQMLLHNPGEACPYPRDSSELQLNRLRQNAAGRVTEYNPNYEFGGSMCTIQDLKEVNRENLTLVK
ncbi:hypothetical protein CHUAL_006729 [Chamberlinius hualienensis]